MKNETAPPLAVGSTDQLGELPEPAFGLLCVDGNTGEWSSGCRTGEPAFDAEQMREWGAACAAEQLASVNALLLELRAMADDGTDRGDVFAQRVSRLLDGA